MLVGLIRVRGLREGGGNSLKYLKRGWNGKEGRGNKDFKKEGKAGSRCGCLKKEVVDWKPLTNYEGEGVDEQTNKNDKERTV